MNLRFTDFEIDVARHELRRAGTLVQIEPQVFDLLVYLVRNRDRTVGKDELIDAIWQRRIVSDATLSSRISAARRALGDSGIDQTLIRTLYKRGFRFVGEVDEGDSTQAPARIDDTPAAQTLDDTADLVPAADPVPLPVHSPILVSRSAAMAVNSRGGGPAEVITVVEPDRTAAATSEHVLPGSGASHSTPAARASGRRPRAPVWVLAAALLAALLSGAAWLLSSPSLKEPVPLTRENELPADKLLFAAPSIMVLPFTNLSGDPNQDHVVDGISESLTSDLTHALPGAAIVSRDTALRYRGRSGDAPQIGRELGVRYLLEGSVVVDGERIRVNCRLIDTGDGAQLSAERFDTERSTILQVQDQIVGRVSRVVGLKLVDIEARRSMRERPNSTEAIDLVLRGRAVLNLPSSPTTMIEARGLFEQALQVQPDDVDGLAGVATTLVFEFVNGYYEAEGDRRLRQAESMLDRALAMDPRHLLALKARAALRRAQGKFGDAIAAAEAAIAENPGEPWTYKEVGLSKLYLGRPEEALDWFAKADQIGPRDPVRWTWLDGRGHALILLGRDEEAIRVLMSGLDANPRNLSSRALLAAAYALLGRTDEARESLALYLQKRPDTTVSTFRRNSPVPLVLTSPQYQRLRERLNEGLRKAGMPE